MTVASFTETGKNYEVSLRGSTAVSCTCPDHQYRHRACKHIINAQGQIDAEIARAATFLALRAQVRETEETARAWREYHAMPW